MKGFPHPATQLTQLRCTTAALLFFFAFWIARLPAQCTGKEGLAALPSTRLNVLVSSRIFSVANRNDVVAAMKIWGDQTGCLSHLNVNSVVDVAETQSDLRRRLLNASADVLVLDNMEFVRLEDAGLVDGIAVASSSGHPFAFSYLLLVNEQTTSLAQLRAKRAIFYLHTSSAASAAWIATLLAHDHLGRLETFFGPSQVSNKPSNCFLPVFFNRAEACVLDSRDWEMAKEMNPQIGKKLRVLAESTPVLDGVTAMRKGPLVERQKLIDAILSSHKYPAGEQILAVFKSGPLIPYKAEFLDSTRTFWNEYALTLTAAERAEWIETGKDVLPKQFLRPSGME